MTSTRRLSLLSAAYLAVGTVIACVVALSDPATRATLTLIPVIGMGLAAFVAARHHGFPRNWIIAAGGIGVLYVAFAAIDGYAASSSSAADVLATSLDLVATVALIGLITAIVRRRRGRLDAGDLLDGAIITMAGWVTVWMAFLRPALLGDGTVEVTQVLDALYLPLGVLLFLLTILFLFSGRLDRQANLLIALSLLTNLTGDVIYALEEILGLAGWALIAADVTYAVAFTAAGAGLVHPSAHELSTEAHLRRRVDLPSRTIAIALSLLAPVMLLAAVPSQSWTDGFVRLGSALVLLGLVGARLFQATRTTIRTQQALLDAARTDDLTSLPNKAAIIEQATDAMDHSWRSDRCPSLFLFDLDRFKNINDSLGHASGDDVIAVIAERLQLAAASLGATVGRPSADEFLVLDPTPTSEHQALSHAEVLHSVFKQPLTTTEGVVFVTASVGVAAMPAGRPISGEELFRWADIAMYRAKDSGRNCLALYHPSMQERVSQRMRVETDLHGALERREFRLFHQPIVDVESGRVAGFEALIRWLQADGTMVSPAEFVPIAEDTGLISEIGAWALLEALTQLATWTDDGIVSPATTVSVNVSPRQLAEPHFADTVEEAIRRSGVDAHRLWLEVTESVMMENPEIARTSLRRVRAMGIRIALDDFGTGYSSLSLLQQFPIQRIKIDRAFVNGIADCSNDRSLVRTVIGLGDSMGLDIVAEGVETVEQLRLLRSLNCAKAQGFLISHPVPAEAMRSTVAALESLSMWPEFAQVVGGEPLQSSSRRPN